MKVSFSLLSHSHADRLPAQVSSQGPLLAVWVGDGSLASILSYLVESTLSKHFVSLLGWHVFCHTQEHTGYLPFVRLLTCQWLGTHTWNRSGNQRRQPSCGS